MKDKFLGAELRFKDIDYPSYVPAAHEHTPVLHSLITWSNYKIIECTTLNQEAKNTYLSLLVRARNNPSCQLFSHCFTNSVCSFVFLIVKTTVFTYHS